MIAAATLPFEVLWIAFVIAGCWSFAAVVATIGARRRRRRWEKRRARRAGYVPFGGRRERKEQR